ncbi:MAG: energy-coupling factor ABC transporter ATP-binding protein [Deltaproteobacteria bacterium]|nr:energy-coupling factor ABC transporter ATP-binding protein [Deltaproteobacteria bacterium]
MKNTMPLFELNDISFAYPGGKTLLDGVTLRLEPGEVIGLMGDNGSGKSTLLHLGAGLIRPLSGTVRIGGCDCRSEADFVLARRDLGYLLQRSQDQLFCPSVLEDVAFGPLNLGLSAKDAEEAARRMLAELGLEHLAACNGNRLSGGEQRLAALAAVLVMDVKFLFLDEPSNDLDRQARERLLSILRRYNLPALVSSHDPDFLERICTRFVLLEDGRLREIR